MTDSDDPTPHFVDKRPRVAGLLPRNAQHLVLGAVALVMILIILFSNRSAPKPKPSPSQSMSEVNEPSLARIQEYRSRIDEQMSKLAAEEAQLTATKQAMGVLTGAPQSSRALNAQVGARPYVGSPTDVDPERTWIERDREKRSYQSLFASNIALTYRPATNNDSTPNGATSEAKEVASAGMPPANNGNGSGSERQYRVFEGTFLETVLTNRLDSSFSGPVDCMVTTNVYSYDGLKLLIPQGSRVLGEVRKLDSFGEQRLAVSFHRLIMPDGYSVSLDQFKGLDQIGETGLRDQINHHYVQVFGISMALGALAGLGQATTHYALDESAAEAYQQGVSTSLSQSAMHVLDRYMNVLPTFTIREGYRIKIYLSQDLMLPSVDAHPIPNDL